MFVLQRARTPACCAPEIWATQEWDIVGWWWWRLLIPSVGPLGIVEGESYSTLAETLGNEAWVQMCCGEANAWIMPSVRCQDLNMLQALTNEQIDIHIADYYSSFHFYPEKRTLNGNEAASKGSRTICCYLLYKSSRKRCPFNVCQTKCSLISGRTRIYVLGQCAHKQHPWFAEMIYPEMVETMDSILSIIIMNYL